MKETIYSQLGLQGESQARKALYYLRERKWHDFTNKVCARESQRLRSRLVEFSDIPFPDKLSELLPTCLSPKERHIQRKRMLLRWHPDKFEQKFGHVLRVSERAAVINQVTEVCKLLTSGMNK